MVPYISILPVSNCTVTIYVLLFVQLVVCTYSNIGKVFRKYVAVLSENSEEPDMLGFLVLY